MASKAKTDRFLVQLMNIPVKLMEMPMNMMKLPVNVMVSSMKTVTESMQEIQRKSETSDESEDSEDGEEGEEGKDSAFRKISRSAMMPYFEMFKLPRSVFASSMKSIAETMQEIRTKPAPANGAGSGEATKSGAEKAVPLTEEESALEAESLLTEDAEKEARTILWQIGRAGRSDFQWKWTEVFDYQIGEDLEAIDSPNIPHFLTSQGGPKTPGGTEKLNLHFDLERDYPKGALALIYDRWGAEKDQVQVDGELLAAVRGAGRGKFRHVALALPELTKGDHLLTFTTTGETEDGGHRIDYFILTAIKEGADKTAKK